MATNSIKVEHTTYKSGGKQEDQSYFLTEAEAIEHAHSMLARHGGRAWINNSEVYRHELKKQLSELPNKKQP